MKPVWRLIGVLAAGASYLAGRALYRKQHQKSAGPVADLSHVPQALQRTAL